MQNKRRTIGGLDFDDFPEEITLTHGVEGEREWFEYWRRNKGIVIQRNTSRSPWLIFFIDGEAIRTYKTPDIKTYETIEEAIKDLREFGLNIKIEER
jgi:hypothetical protein